MKLELSIGGKVVIIEAEGSVSVQVLDENPAVVAPVVAPAVVSESAKENAPESGADSDDLFVKLVELRRELATASNVPPYVVFKDNTLREMVEKRPADLAAFGNIGGVGKAKLEKYGEMFLSVINEGAAA